MDSWRRLNLSGEAEGRENVLPPAGKEAVLYLIPRRRTLGWGCDIGRAYLEGEANVPRWESAFGIMSSFDGASLQALSREYEIWFAGAPPLLNGRVPPGFANAERKEG